VNSPLLIAIVGGSGAGKTWLASRLEKALAPRVARISQDDFYRDLSHLPMHQRVRVNFDHPRAIDWAALETELRELQAGRPARLPRYDFSSHCRRADTRLLRPKPIVLVEGLWLLRRPSLRKLFARRLFVECPSELCLKRRIRRDTTERGRTRASVVEQFHRHVGPMFERFVIPQTRWADTVLPSPISAARLRTLLADLQARATDAP
jgi:uridine kinase